MTRAIGHSPHAAEDIVQIPARDSIVTRAAISPSLHPLELPFRSISPFAEKIGISSLKRKLSFLTETKSTTKHYPHEFTGNSWTRESTIQDTTTICSLE